MSTDDEFRLPFPLRAPVLISANDETLERMCRAHWPTWDRMRPDHQRKWREKMKAALLSTYSDGVLR